MRDGSSKMSVEESSVVVAEDGDTIQMIGMDDATDSQLPHIAEDVEPVSSVLLAIQAGDIDGLQEALRESDVECGGGGGCLTPLHTATHIRHLASLTTILTHGAKVDALDGHGNTALHTAVSEGWRDGVAELLKYGASPNTHSNTPAQDTPLQSAVRLCNTETALIMLDYHPDLTVVDSEGWSLLHLAARAQCPDIICRLVKEKACQDLLHSSTSQGYSVFHAALTNAPKQVKEDAVLEIMQTFFEAGVDVNLQNNLGETPIYLAAYLKLSRCVELLLTFGADPFLLTATGQSTVHAACKSGCAASLKHLLDTGKVSELLLKRDGKNREPFHYAVNSSSIACCELLLKNGDHLTQVDEFGVSRVNLLLEFLPNAPHLLTRLFDANISLSSESRYHQDFHITFHYSGIFPLGGKETQSFLIGCLCNSQAENLLKHPLVESCLCFKWSKIKYFFYSNLLSYLFFIVLHTAYILSVYQKSSVIRQDFFSVTIFRVLHILMYLLILCPEIVTICANPLKYLHQWETLTKAISLITSACVVFSHSFLNTLEPAQMSFNATAGSEDRLTLIPLSMTKQVAAVSVFFGWVEFMMLCGRLPILGLYVLMFTRIAKSTIKFIIAFACLLVGFASSFNILFGNLEEFATFGTSLVKTLMMMIGEVDYSDLVNPRTAYISYLILVVFLFLVCILMTNLLVGLAVDDISSLESMGKIERLSRQTTYIITFEKTARMVQHSKLFPRFVVKALFRLSHISPKKCVYVNRKISRAWHRKKHYIPSDTLQQAIKIVTTNQTDPESVAPGDTQEKDVIKELHQKLTNIEKMLSTNLSELTAHSGKQSTKMETTEVH